MLDIDERRVAVHEAGHVVVAYLENVVVQRVTIDLEQAEKGFGGVWYPTPKEMNEDDLLSRGRVAWAGSVAESIVFDSALKTSWASDVKSVYELVSEYGRHCGPRYVGERAKETARQELETNRSALDEVTRLLLRHRTIDGEQLTAILDGLIP